jgi:hypothetical protein
VFKGQQSAKGSKMPTSAASIGAIRAIAAYVCRKASKGRFPRKPFNAFNLKT